MSKGLCDDLLGNTLCVDMHFLLAAKKRQRSRNHKRRNMVCLSISAVEAEKDVLE